jgi:hypothetical protein
LALEKSESSLETIVRQTVAVNDLLKGFDPTVLGSGSSNTNSSASATTIPARYGRFDFTEFVDIC